MSYIVTTDEVKQGSFIDERLMNTLGMSFHMGQQDLTRKMSHDEAPATKCNPSVQEDENSNWKGAQSDRAGSSGADTQSDTSSDNAADVDSVRPMTDMLRLGSFDSFVIDCQAGITGKSVMAKFPCILDSSRFFVWLGSTMEVNLFGKATLMNLANLAEEKGAKEMYLILGRNHPEVKAFLRMFKVIDAKKVKADQAQELVLEDQQAKVLEVAFYRIDL